MYDPRFTLADFETLPPSDKMAVVSALLEALIVANLAHLKAHPEAPALYESGVTYAREPTGRDDWQNIPDTIARGDGDCEDLACWRVAELRAKGVRANVHVLENVIDGDTVFHIQVETPRGIEDPSRRLGMSGEAEAIAEKLAQEEKPK